MRKTYHLCLASHDEVMHRSEEDYIYDVNCMALAILRTGSRGLADSVMSTLTIYASNLMTSTSYVLSVGMPIHGISITNMAGRAVSAKRLTSSAKSMDSGILRQPSAMSTAILSIMVSARPLSDSGSALPTLSFRRLWEKSVLHPLCRHPADTIRCQATSSFRCHIGWIAVG